MSSRAVLMNAAEIDRALSRIAHEVLEYTGGAQDLALVGIHTRGAPLARRLASKIARAGAEMPPIGVLDINLYRDDLSGAADHPVVRSTELPFSIAEKQVLLVDDVLFTGRTIRAALDALTDLGRPRAIRLAVLINRGARELPIQPDFCGRTFTAREDQEIVVRLAEIDGGADQVRLMTRAQIERDQQRKPPQPAPGPGWTARHARERLRELSARRGAAMAALQVMKTPAPAPRRGKAAKRKSAGAKAGKKAGAAKTAGRRAKRRTGR